ncbi:tetratricopeptide repeat protein, partial [Actinotignum timonense]|uniref:tetratricopeptide repeat protein n=1 Tax=Actinotignum timonense TaxID=1870995 RepID=UPI002A83DAB7
STGFDAATVVIVVFVAPAADIEVAAGRPDLGFTRLINAIKVTSGDVREELRTHLLELFTAVGADTEVVRSARRDLASALF